VSFGDEFHTVLEAKSPDPNAVGRWFGVVARDPQEIAVLEPHRRAS
jgi:hypothetical protein